MDQSYGHGDTARRMKANHDPFWDRIAPTYARKHVADPAAYAEKLALVASLLRKQDHVLEIGCGTGTTALHLAPGVARYTATDGARAMIALAQAKLAHGTSDKVTFRQADAVADVPGAPFDAILAFSLLHLVANVPEVLAALRAQLKPGGLFVSKTACLRDAPLPIRLLVPALTGLRLAPRVTPLGRAELIRHIERAGFVVERVTHFGTKRTSPVIVARRAAP